MGSMGIHRFNGLLHRLLAAGCIALVFALTVFAASPDLHERLHHDTDATSSLDDGCAIVLFGNGVSASLAYIAVPPRSMAWSEQVYARPAALWLDSPRYRLLPGRGPPAA
jgi:hypothetical protein